MRKKLQKGLTLVELLVVLVLMGLITTAITMVLRPTTNLYIDVNNKTNEEIAAITLFDVLNGELRYATDINIVSAADDSVMPASSLQHFIVLSNCKRDGNHLNAYGYIKHGYTAHGLIGAKAVGSSDSLLENTDIKFSIDGYSSEAGRESITVGAVMHPMNTKGIMLNKEYKYSETFKLLNMQNRAQLTKTTIGSISTVNYDSAAVQDGIQGLLNNNNSYTGGEQAIFIFYQKPDEAPSTVSSTSLSTSTTFQPFTVVPGNKEIDLGAVLKEAVIHVDSGVTGNVELHGGVSTVWNGNPKSGDCNFPVSIQDYSVKFSSDTVNDYILFHLTDGTDFKVTGADLAASPVSIEKYLYDDGTGTIVHDTEFVSPDSLPEPVTQTIHFVTWPGASGKGITVQNTSGKNKAIAAGAGKLNADAETTTKGSSFNVNIVYYLTGSRAKLKLAGEYNTIGDLAVDEFTEDNCPELWVASNGNVYLSEADCLADVPIPSMSVDAAGATVSGVPNQYYGTLSYNIPITNTSSCICSDYTVGFHFDGPFTINEGGCSVSGAGGNKTISFASGDFTVTVSGDSFLPGTTKTITVNVAGATGQPVNNISDYTPTTVWGSAS